MSLPDKKRKASEDLNTAARSRDGHVFQSVNISGGCNILGDYYVSQPSACQKLLDSLMYQEMNARFNDIADPCDNNFDWVFKKPQPSEEDWPIHPADICGFEDWLLNDYSTFWVSGKPGSGKSTFMKYVAGHPETRRVCDSSTDTPCTFLAHYFWMSGSTIQSNMKGCLSSLCWQLVRTQTNTIERLIQPSSGLGPASRRLPSLPADLAALPHKSHLEDWSVRESESCLCFLLQACPGKVYMFLDGLDEFNQNRNLGDILSLLTRITQSPNVKLCISSRPELPLETSLARHPMMRIHDFTRKDVFDIAASRLSVAVTEIGWHQITLENTLTLACEIASHAEGVFIWALLAIESTIDGLYMT